MLVEHPCRGRAWSSLSDARVLKLGGSRGEARAGGSAGAPRSPPRSGSKPRTAKGHRARLRRRYLATAASAAGRRGHVVSFNVMRCVTRDGPTRRMSRQRRDVLALCAFAALLGCGSQRGADNAAVTGNGAASGVGGAASGAGESSGGAATGPQLLYDLGTARAVAVEADEQVSVLGRSRTVSDNKSAQIRRRTERRDWSVGWRRTDQKHVRSRPDSRVLVSMGQPIYGGMAQDERYVYWCGETSVMRLAK